jgi:alkylated DNA nucleotide flippase Atl1
VSNVDVNDFGEEKVCVYKNETYSVRDNGAVFRHQREGKRTRRNDNKWTFGKVGDKGYLYIAGVQVHRIVATAFHGEHLSREYIVDHKDTNKQNNRSENLHWCTREENVLNNPNTIDKIEYITGHSIDEVLEDWSILHKVKHKQDTSWMRPVTKKEAKNLKDKQLEWRQNKKQSSNGVMGEWVFNRNNTIRKQTEKERIIEEKYQSYNSEFFSKPHITIITESLTPNAVQRKWKIPSEFPCCPK